MKVFAGVLLGVALLQGCRAYAIAENEIVRETPRIKSGDELLSAVVNDCFGADSTMECLKVKVLTYLDSVLGLGEESSRSFDGDRIDSAIYDRVGRILAENEFRVTLPEFIFQNAQIVYRSDRGLDVAFPEENGRDEYSEARGLLKKKLLLPVLLLLKLKMKALMPIFVALIGLKAMKALILSKLAIVLVVGFLVSQLLKKGGMPMPMSMMPTPAEPPAPSTAYGPAAPSTAYGVAAASSASSVATPADSYSPNWEPSSAYSRVWDTAASHNVAYNAYYPGSSGSSSGSSGSSSSSYSPSSDISITSSSSS